jgi:hypothetical protein
MSRQAAQLSFKTAGILEVVEDFQGGLTQSSGQKTSLRWLVMVPAEMIHRRFSVAPCAESAPNEDVLSECRFAPPGDVDGVAVHHDFGESMKRGLFR